MDPTGSGVVAPSWTLAVVLLVLAAVAVAAVRAARLDLGRAVVTAAGRAGLQLAVVSALLVMVFGSMWLTLAYVTVMLVVAGLTAGRRLGLPLRRPWPLLPVAVGAVPVAAVVLVSGTVPWQPESVVPVVGILLGGAMTATTLAGRRMGDTLRERAGEYEAALSVGLVPSDAALEISRESAGLALVPALDQTRTVGLVTLPGAFVGVLLGGGSAVEAGAAQLLVLIGLLATQALAVLVTVQLVGRRRLLAPDLLARLPR